ncbi:DeoR/GlpR family DNA-binding transcription regulator [Notoacmeibacter sp. MSK16QG-6]|uniref:DeoR/GlpR family DNA-binding transcription regulator n=1 Tax=Notoacmeibacter sp. MSK16QG-6 TaxID=2957982 RepID=UPI00209F88F8|nr:DeoR/GlpR family DNA-binding transcription regulator [Notoacmeibacter sp. MSK16QG-6]MCP1199809.1 DeoR/GlpR family DNA-binding transcription regulator [Notoacmeibacter sp. MSK16QG-6]
MSETLRHPEILELARQHGKVTVESLAGHFGVTVQTIRRDLSELAETGRLKRVHGGAVPVSGVTNFGYEERRNLNEEEKHQIGRRCAAVIPESSSVFLNIGTSTEAVARELLLHRNLLVVTNNLNIANIMVSNESCEIIVAGGVLRRSDGGLVGGMTNRVVEQFKFDYAVLGCSALDVDGDMLDFDTQEVGVSQTALARARTNILVADHSKFERSAPARIGSLSDIDIFFTDRPVNPDLARLCDDWGTQICLPE